VNVQALNVGIVLEREDGMQVELERLRDVADAVLFPAAFPVIFPQNLNALGRTQQVELGRHDDSVRRLP
jgi:hypothetical protein